MLKKILDTYDCVQLLEMVDSVGCNALHYACSNGCFQAAEIILNAVVAFDSSSSSSVGDDRLEIDFMSRLCVANMYGFTPEALALKNGHEDLFRLIFRTVHGYEAESQVSWSRLSV